MTKSMPSSWPAPASEGKCLRGWRRGLEDFGAGFEGAHEARDGPFGDFAQEGFELGEGFFDGVHIRTVGWEISQLRARRLDELLDPRPLVSREIVHDDDLAGQSVGTRHVSSQSSNRAALIGPSKVFAAVRPRRRRPATKVTVL